MEGTRTDKQNESILPSVAMNDRSIVPTQGLPFYFSTTGTHCGTPHTLNGDLFRLGDLSFGTDSCDCSHKNGSSNKLGNSVDFEFSDSEDDQGDQDDTRHCSSVFDQTVLNDNEAGKAIQVDDQHKNARRVSLTPSASNNITNSLGGLMKHYRLDDMGMKCGNSVKHGDVGYTAMIDENGLSL